MDAGVRSVRIGGSAGQVPDKCRTGTVDEHHTDSGECVDCLAIGEETPWFRYGKSPRCTRHLGEHKRWLDRTSTAARRSGRPVGEVRAEKPFVPRPVTLRAEERLITPQQTAVLHQMVDEVRRKREVLDNGLRQKRPLHPQAVGDLLVEVGYLLEAIDKMLWPTGTLPPGRGRLRKYRSARQKPR